LLNDFDGVGGELGDDGHVAKLGVGKDDQVVRLRAMGRMPTPARQRMARDTRTGLERSKFIWAGRANLPGKLNRGIPTGVARPVACP